MPAGRRDATRCRRRARQRARRKGSSFLPRPGDDGAVIALSRPQQIDRKEVHRQFKAADAAYRRGALADLREALGNPEDFPNCRQPIEWGLGTYPLGYAIYWSPIAFIRELIGAGADLNYDDGTGFPSLIATLSTDRSDKHAILSLLILEGADLNRHGINDWTPLHYAVVQKDLESLTILLEAGADRALRTRIDDCETPSELAARCDFGAGANLLSGSRAGQSRK